MRDGWKGRVGTFDRNATGVKLEKQIKIMKTRNAKKWNWSLVLAAGLSLLSAGSAPAQSVYNRWMNNTGGTVPESAIGLAEDLSTNVYVLGRYYGFTDKMGNTLLTNEIGTSNIFVAALYGNNGTNPPSWAKTPVTDYPISNARIGSDPNGDIIIAGSYGGTNLSLGTYGVTNYGTGGGSSEDVFMAGLNGNSGAVNWLQHAGGAAEDTLGDMHVNLYGGAYYITGSFQSPTFAVGTSNFVRQSTSGADFYLAQFNMSGTLTWASQGAYASGTCLASDSSGNCYIGGTALGAVTIGGLSPASQTTTNFFIKYNSSGTPLWIRGDMVIGSHIYVDQAANIYTVGTFSNVLQIGTTTLSNNAPSTIFVAKYDSNGNPLWAQQAPGWGYDGATGILTDPGTNVWVSGYFASSSQGSLPTNSIAILACYDPSGNLQTVAQTSGAGPSAMAEVNGIFPGNTCVVGTFSTNFTLANRTVSNSGNSDVFASIVALIPGLAISASGGHVVCSWPANGNGGYQLQVLTNLASSNWSSAGSPMVVNGRLVVTNTPTGAFQFYRLINNNP